MRRHFYNFASFNILKLVLAGLLFHSAGCGGGNFFVPDYSLPPQVSESADSLQIVRVGESLPLQSLVATVGDVVFLDVLNSPVGFSVNWSSSDVLKGLFVNPGELHLTRIGEFLIRVQVGSIRQSLPVTVTSRLPNEIENLPPPDFPEEELPPPVASDPFMDQVVSFNPGPHAGFGAEAFPDIVLGGPRGGGDFQSSLDVLSLGVRGEILLYSEAPFFDGPGADFIVFENPFLIGGNPDTPFVELAQVAVSQDGVEFFAFSCATQDAAEGYPGCGGVRPVYANIETNGLDPTDPEVAGGDAFDLSALGLSWGQYIRIRDLNTSGSGSSAGFDLDAIACRYQEMR